ncbi:hypothetical protein K457DRAFT_144025 [Linnemannia elongata AG-77]|uniref:U1-type domain-containing protein n=1 Tax=Linnemannia elongata AG-77 TaxID=1314771 RepID=A0A197KCX8_9FUNG|nr:hypothetical protein K457DRAFT_144025 [Linnemannia elongata AG-77]
MEEFERRAKERAARDKEKAEEDEARALAEKSERLVLESAIGKSQVVQGGPNGRAPGFHCKICDCVLKDSTAYMDHKNGKKHLKNLGIDRKAVREDLNDVVAKLESMKRKAEVPKKDKYDLDATLEEVKRQEDRERAEKRERKKQKKNDKKPDEGFDDGGMDPAMAAMMGFSGFGSSKS